MSIFADQVSMPTFGMTQYSGDWRSKARANIAARENAMLQQMAEATDPQTQIDTGMAQLSSFFNPETEEVSDIDKLVNVLSMVNQGADPTTVAAVNAVQEADDSEEYDPGIVKEILNEFTPKDEASIAAGGPEYTDASVTDSAIYGGALAGQLSQPAARKIYKGVTGKTTTDLIKDLDPKSARKYNLPGPKMFKDLVKELTKKGGKKAALRLGLMGLGPVGAALNLALLAGELCYAGAKYLAPEATENFQSAVGGTLRNVGGGIMDMFRGDDNFQVGQNTKKAHGGRVHKALGGIMGGLGNITNTLYTPPPPPATMLPYTPFMTPEYAAQYYSQNF